MHTPLHLIYIDTKVPKSSQVCYLKEVKSIMCSIPVLLEYGTNIQAPFITIAQGMSVHTCLWTWQASFQIPDVGSLISGTLSRPFHYKRQKR